MLELQRIRFYLLLDVANVLFLSLTKFLKLFRALRAKTLKNFDHLIILTESYSFRAVMIWLCGRHWIA